MGRLISLKSVPTIYISLLFVMIYLPVGKGILFSMSAVGLFISLLVMNRTSMAVSLILFSGPVLGLLFSLWGISISGFAVASGVGFFLTLRYWRVFMSERAIVISLLCVLVMFTFSYFIGPRHAYSNEKIINILVVGSTSAFGWLLLLKSNDVESGKIAQFLLIESLLYIAIAIDIYGWSRPSSLWDFDFIRMPFYQSLYAGDLTVSYHLIGLNAATAIAFMLAPIKVIDLKNVFNAILLVIAIMIVIVSQARQAIFGVMSVFLFRILLDKRISWNKKISFAIIICYILMIGISSIKTETIDNSLSATDATGFFNRDYNMYLSRATTGSVFLGTGLGGYSLNGERDYPHNILIELYGETGIVGILILSFLLLISWLRNPCSLNKISNSQLYILIPIVIFFIRAMVSSDLSENIKFISAMIVLVNVNKKVN